MSMSTTNIISSVVYNQAPASVTSSSRTKEEKAFAKSESSNSVYADEKERKENEAMVYKMQMSTTKLSTLGEYFGAMQEALKDSGNNGIMAYRRTSNLIHNGTNYMDTSDYQKKENSKCLVKDITDSMEESKKALEETKDSKKESKEEASISKEIAANEEISSNEEVTKEEKVETTSISLSEQITEKSILPDFVTADKQNKLQNPSGKTIDISL